MAVGRVLSTALLCALAAACSAPATAPVETAAGAISSSSTGVPFPPQSTGALPAAQVAELEKEMSRWVEKDLLTGVTAAVVTQSGSWSGAAGVDGAGVPLVPEAAMAIASITKTFVSAEVLRLAEHGEVDLDAPASTYVDHPLLARGPTVRQLLSMTSGLPEVPVDVYDELVAEPERSWTALEVLARVTSKPLPPGVRFKYENVNYVFLGLLIEGVTGRPLAEVMRTEMWAPQALERIAFQDAEAVAPPVARPGPDDEVPDDLPVGPFLPWRSLASAVGASGSVAADAMTVARWGYALYGGRVLEEGTTRDLLESARGTGYGLGVAEIGMGRLGTEVVGHPGDVPGFKAILAVFPERRVSMVILAPGSVATEPYVAHLAREGGLLPPPPS